MTAECQRRRGSESCGCPRCERVELAERHERAARRLRARGEHDRARGEAVQAARARIAAGLAADAPAGA